MKIFLRHVLKGFLGLLILCLGLGLVMFVVIDFVGSSKIWMGRPPGDAYRYYLYYTPHILYLLFPVALLLASVFSVGNLARHLELVALRAAGISVLRILSPILLFGALAGAVMFWFQDSVLPDANHKRFAINEPKSQDNDGEGDPLERFNFLYSASDGSRCFFEYYSGHTKTGSGITLLTQPKSGALALRIDAKSLAWSNGWILRNGTKRVFGDSGIHAIPFKEMALREFKDKPSELIDDRIYPDEMPIREMEKRIVVLKRSGESASALETQRHFRFSSALVNLIMVIIGTAMSVHTIKTGLARNFGIALLITFLYYVALRLGLVMGENGTLPPVWGAWFGNLLFAPLALGLMWKAARI